MKIAQRNKSIFLILFLAFFIRIILMCAILVKNPDGIYQYDSYGYWNLGYNIAQNGVFSQSEDIPLELDYYRTPVYPLFIAFAEFIGPEGFTIIFLQIILSVLTCYVTYLLCKKIIANDFIANTAALIVAVDLPSITLSNLVLTETLFSFLFISCFYYFVLFLKQHQIKYLLYAAVLSGLCMLCRPIGFFIPFLLGIFLIFDFRKNVKDLTCKLIIFSAVIGLTVSPWLIRNKIAFNHYFLSVIREHNLLNYQAGTVYADRFNYSVPKAQSILRWKTFKEFKGDAHAQPYEYAKHIEKEAVKIIAENPVIFMKYHVEQILYFFLKPSRAYFEIQLGLWGEGYNFIPKDYPISQYLFKHTSTFTIVLVFIQMLVLAIVYFSCCFGMLFLFRNKERLILVLVLLTIFAVANLNLPPATEARFRIPVWPLIAILSACGLFFLKQKCFKSKTA